MPEMVYHASKDDEVESIITFAEHLVTQLVVWRSDQIRPLPDVALHLTSSFLPRTEIDSLQAKKLKSVAVLSWNAVSDLKIDDLTSPHGIAFVQIRAFVMMLLSRTITPKLNTVTKEHFVRVLGITKECIEADLLDLAQEFLHDQESIYGLLGNQDVQLAEIQEHEQLAARYRYLQLLLSWRTGREDLADVRFAQMNKFMFRFDEEGSIELTCLLLEIGRVHIDRGEGERAVRWLERADKVLDYESAQQVSDSNLRLNVSYNLARARFAMPGIVNRQIAWKYVNSLVDENKDFELPIQLLALEMSFEDHVDETAMIANRLEEIVQHVYIVPATHHLILRSCEKLAALDSQAGFTSLQNYIGSRLRGQGNQLWTDEALLAFIEMNCKYTGSDAVQVLSSIEPWLNNFAVSFYPQVASHTAQAVHLALWPRIQQAADAGQHSLCTILCQVGLQPIFHLAGDKNYGKLSRQLIRQHLYVYDVEIARKFRDNLPSKEKSHPLGRFLSYCIELRSGKDEAAEAHLNTIANIRSTDDSVLLACIHESIQFGKPYSTAKILQRVFDRRIISRKPGIDLIAVLKQTARLLSQTISAYGPGRDVPAEVLERFCAIFRYAAKMKIDADHESGHPELTDADTSWFADFGLQQAQKNIKSWPAKFVIDLLHYSCQLLKYSMTTTGCQSDNQKTRFRIMEADYAQAALYAVETRRMLDNMTAEDLPKTCIDSRLRPDSAGCRVSLHTKVYQLFMDMYNARTNDIITTKNGPLLSAYDDLLDLLPLAFEAVLFVGGSAYMNLLDTHFDETSCFQMIDIAKKLGAPPEAYATLTDVLLTFTMGSARRTSQAEQGLITPKSTAMNLLKKIVQCLCEIHDFSVEEAARWLRCMQQLVVTDIEDILVTSSEGEIERASSTNLVLLNSLLEQTNNIVHSRKNQAYPREELEWTASKVFNLAIDLLNARQYTVARDLAQKALATARWISVEDTDDEVEYVGLACLLHKKLKEIDWSPLQEHSFDSRVYALNTKTQMEKNESVQAVQVNVDDIDFDMDAALDDEKLDQI